MKELEAFNPEMARRPQIIVANKIDLLGNNKRKLEPLKRLAIRRKLAFFAVSALRNDGLDAVVAALADKIFPAHKSGGSGAAE